MILLLIVTIGLLSSLWTGALTSGVWTAGALVIHLVIIRNCRQFLDEPPSTANLRSWRLRFIMLDLFFGMAWTFILINPIGVDEQAAHLHAVRHAAGGGDIEHAGVEPADRGVRADLAGHHRDRARFRAARARCTITSSPSWR